MPAKKTVEYRIDENGCHICTSHKTNSDGYPLANYGGVLWRLNRRIYHEANGDIPKGIVIRHACDNRLCINIEHLIPGTITDNNIDRKLRGRNRNQSGENNNMNKLIESSAIEILKSDLPRSKLAKMFGVCRQTIDMIKTGKRWAHLKQSA